MGGVNTEDDCADVEVNCCGSIVVLEEEEDEFVVAGWSLAWGCSVTYEDTISGVLLLSRGLKIPA